MTGRPNTPGILGYVLAVAMACGTAGSLTYVTTVVLGVGTDEGGDILTAVVAAIVYVPLLTLFAATYGFPVAVAGVLVVHVALRRVERQACHVLAAGVVGALLSAGYADALGFDDLGPDVLVVAVSVGVGAAAGRVAVIPLVESRRRLADQGRLAGTARW